MKSFTHGTLSVLLVIGILCAGSVRSALASESGDGKNPSDRPSMKQPADRMETITTETQPRIDQDQETSLKMKAERPMSAPEIASSTHESTETLSQPMLDLIQSQNEQAALGF